MSFEYAGEPTQENPIETEAPQQEAQSAEPTPPAEAKNPDIGPVPYERFKEVNDRLADVRKSLESDDYKGFQRLNEALNTNPEFAKYLYDSVHGFFAPKPEAPKVDPLNEYPQEIANPLRQVENLSSIVDQLRQESLQAKTQAIYQQYQADYSGFIKEVPDDLKGVYQTRAMEVAGRISPNALAQYDPQLAKAIFEAVDTEIKSIQRSDRARYVQDKRQDNLPASSSSGASGESIEKTQTQQQRLDLVKELLRASG